MHLLGHFLFLKIYIYWNAMLNFIKRYIYIYIYKLGRILIHYVLSAVIDEDTLLFLAEDFTVAFVDLVEVEEV